VSVDTFDYILTKVHDSLENQTTWTVEKKKKEDDEYSQVLENASGNKWIYSLLCRSALNAMRLPKPAACLCCWLDCFHVSESQAAGCPAPLCVWLWPEASDDKFLRHSTSVKKNYFSEKRRNNTKISENRHWCNILTQLYVGGADKSLGRNR
jgi:hypothetical protein